MSDARSSGWLPALLCLAAATVAWTLADEQRARLPALTQQLKTAQGLIERTRAAGTASAESSARQLRDQRQAFEQRLVSTDTEAIARAQAVFTLRELCTASLATVCQVRLSDEIGTGAAKAVASAASSAATLPGLGVAKARAVVSGNFQADEIERLVRSLQRDPKHHWRINGVLVRNNSFELDVERHFIERP